MKHLNNYNEEESFIYGNFTADGHGFQVKSTNFDQQAELQAFESQEATVRRFTKDFSAKIVNGKLVSNMETKVKTLTNRWFDAILNKTDLSQEEMIQELDNFFELAEKIDAKNYKVDPKDQGQPAEQRRITGRIRQRVRVVAKSRVIDLIVDFCGQHYYSGDHPVIEDFAQINDQKRGSDAWTFEVDPTNDRWVQPQNQVNFSDRKIAKARERQYSEICDIIINFIRSRKDIHRLGKRIFQITKRTEFTKDELNKIWATYKGFAYYRRLDDPFHNLLSQVRNQEITGKELWKITKEKRSQFTQRELDNIWTTYQRMKK